MQFRIDKNLVKDKFLSSIKTYDNNAIIQKEMAKILLDIVIEKIGNNYNNVLEIGSGTGLLTQKIVDNIEFKKLITNDLSENYKGIIRGIVSNLNIDYKFIEGDAECFEFPENNNLIISNATFQWFDDLNKFIIQSEKLLNKNGILAFTSFGTENFNEISSIYNNGLNYLPINEILKNTDNIFEVVHTFSYKKQLFFNDPFAVLKHIKNTGVNGIINNNKIKLKEFFEIYTNKYANEQGVSLTYNPVFIILKKK
jgi:malonyl-ACP O-methyltransferase BioC